MMLPVITSNGKTLVYAADLVPSVGHLPIPYVMGYDVRPLETLKEKENILAQVANNNWYLFFEHDPVTECVSLEMTEKGPRKKESFKLSEIF
jgi:hypothetical protein